MRVRSMELGIGGATLSGSTVAYLADDPRLGVIALVLGGIAFGITLARGGHDA